MTKKEIDSANARNEIISNSCRILEIDKLKMKLENEKWNLTLNSAKLMESIDDSVLEEMQSKSLIGVAKLERTEAYVVSV